MKLQTAFALLFASTVLSGTARVVAAPVDATIGTVTYVEGDVHSTTGSTTPTVLSLGAAVHSGDTLRTGAIGEAHLEMTDGGFIALRPNTTFRLDSYSAVGETTDSEAFSLLNGAIRSITGWIGKLNPEGYRLQTPTATIGIRGTDHETVYISPESAVDDETSGTYDRVNSGATSVQTAQGTVNVAAGQAAHVPHGAAPAPRLLDKPPAFLNRRRTRNEARVIAYSAQIRQHIEARLQARGLLKSGEHAHDYFYRKHRDRKQRGLSRNGAHRIGAARAGLGRRNPLRAERDGDAVRFRPPQSRSSPRLRAQAHGS